MLMVFAKRMEMILRGPIGPHKVLCGLKALAGGYTFVLPDKSL